MKVLSTRLNGSPAKPNAPVTPPSKKANPKSPVLYLETIFEMS